MWQRSWCQLQASRKGEKVVSDPIEGRCLERLQLTGDLQQENGWASSPVVIWRGESQTKEKCSLSSFPDFPPERWIHPRRPMQSIWVRIPGPGWMVWCGEQIGGPVVAYGSSYKQHHACECCVTHLADAMCLINIGPGYLINMKRIGESCILWFIFIANLAFNFLDKLNQDSSCS